ncbi:hypothetical protein Micbo1qcDRAFT_201503 [Microdochium bolleyi]|uniref:Uncharacterized protein n=1 Tax=Microdochium bolleyi TaxID=196109 RepID=A0A136JG91_9PEZI|nr:hypothetical protein Micbo1qcDRAFT_201503 [Microdochium bolleyi]
MPMPMLPNPVVSVLGPDPTHNADDRGRAHVLNGNAFQQDAILTFEGWQYVCFYSALGSSRGQQPPPGSSTPPTVEPVYVHLSRRQLPSGQWQTFVFDDYPQTTDDGHNTVQLGICPGDGTIHLSYDHHCDTLRYRHSVPDLALNPEAFTWTPEHFTPTLSRLPGLAGQNGSDDPELDALLGYITYPRFGTLGASKLWFSFRTGKAGLGDDHLAVYDPAAGGYGRPVTHLKGVDSNPYINGLDYRAHPHPHPQHGGSGGALYTTWVYRGFVWYPGWDDPDDTKHKAQAGPNSGANNHDLCFAYSEDEGNSWRNGAGEIIAVTETGSKGGQSVEPASPGIRAFEIPKGSGLANQESQAVDHDGGVHVLNRDRLADDDDRGGETGEKGEVRWKHYYRSPTGQWTQTALPQVHTSYGGKRGQVAASRAGDLYFILPEAVAASSTTTTGTTTGSPADPPQRPARNQEQEQILTVLRATKASRYTDYQVVWRSGDGSSGAAPSQTRLWFPPTEPLVDRARLDSEDVLSVFTRTYHSAAAAAAAAAGGNDTDVGGADESSGRGVPSGSQGDGRVDVVVLDFDLSSLA